jgi:hypothetical protein
MFEDVTAKAEREGTFTLTVDNEILHEMGSDIGVLVLAVNFAISDNLIVSDICPHMATFMNTLGLLLLVGHTD